MAKKKTTTVVEEETLETPKDPTYEEIHGKSMEQIAKDPPKSEEIEPIPEEAKEPVKEEEVPVVVQEPKIDPEQLKKETTEAATQAVKEELADFLKKKDEKEDNRDNYQKWADQFSEETGKAPSWVDVAKFLKDEAKAEIRAEQEEVAKKAEETTKQQEDQKQKYLADFNKEVDEELNELYSANKLPRIKDDQNPNDPGVKARDALFQAMAATNTERVKQGLTPIKSVSRIYANYYKAPSRQPAGADAAIINNRSGSASADGEEINYLRDVKGGFKSLYNAVTKR